MATYLTDLFILNQVETPSTDGTISEFTGATAGGTGGNQGKTDETDFFIQGAQCVSKNFNATGIGGYGYDNGTPFTVPADGATYTWTYWAAPNSVTDKSTGGHQIHLGNTTSAYRRFFVDGSDSQQYGGWRCYPVNYAQSDNGTTSDQGSPNGTTQVLGYAVNNASAISKGNPYGLDVMRYGRGTIAVDNSVDTSTGDFDTIAAYNDKNSTGAVTGFVLIQTGFHRLGVFSLQNGVYQLQGRILLGQGSAPITTEAGGLQSASPVTFTDSNKSIVIQECIFCSANFNAIEIQNASSVINLTNISINSLAGEAGNPARGNIIVTDAATVNLSSCNFQNMGVFSFNTGTTVSSCVFTNSGTITQNGGSISECTISDTISTETESIITTTTGIATITNNRFNRASGAINAVFIGGLTGTGTTDINWDGNILNGYGSQTAGTNISSTAGGAIRLEFTSGTTTVRINVINGATIPTVEIVNNGGTGTVDIVSSITVNISGLLGNSEISVLNNPSPYSWNGVTPATQPAVSFITSTESVSANTFTGDNTNYYQINTGGTFVTIDAVGSAVFSNFPGVLQDTNASTPRALADGDKIRVTVRDDLDNPTLQLFDEFEVDADPTAPTTTSIITKTLSSAFTSKFGTAITGANSKTVTVEKVKARYQFSISDGTVIDFATYRIGSIPILNTDQTIASDNNSFPLSQIEDRNYKNPA